ncbi:MAG: DUF1592 domain-containing protein [Lentisphaeraceae bacterium]|nr:DUF1592 domain-containing protein [Lentisphaeraceae bacterium]
MKVTFLVVCMASFFAVSLSADEKSSHTLFDIKNKTFLEDNCQRCHNAKKKKGKFRVDNLSYKIDSNLTAASWQKILDSLNSNEMPPEDEDQPDGNKKADFLDALANTMVKARKSLSSQNGVITMRRLNRREYSNSLRELLGVEINVMELPGDTSPGGFDTVGSNLFMSSNQIEQYLSLGKEALVEAFIWKNSQNVKKKLRFEAEKLSEKYKKYIAKIIDAKARAERWKAGVEAAMAKPENKAIMVKLKKEFKHDSKIRRQWAQIKGAPAPEDFGFNTKENNSDKANSALRPYYLEYFQHYMTLPNIDRGAYLTIPTVHPSVLPTGYLEFQKPHSWPAGNYIVRIKAGADQKAPKDRRLLEFGVNAAHGKVMSTHEVTAPLDNPQVIEIPITFTRKHTSHQSRQVFFREKASDYYLSNPRRVFNKAKKENKLGLEYVLWVDWMEIERLPNTHIVAPGIEALEVPLDNKAKNIDQKALRRSFENFSQIAFRGEKAPKEFIDRLMNIYAEQRENKSKHVDALQYTLSIVLASPMFIYISEPSEDKKARALTGEELATRLAFFLWGAPADKQLTQLGKSGELFKSKVLKSETKRLLDDPRSSDFVHSFSYQWLGLDRLAFFEADVKKFLKFDDSVKVNAKREIYETISYTLRNNLSLKNLLKSDYVIINNVMANFYGIPGVNSDEFIKVPVPEDSPRGGLLGMSAIHLMGGNGDESNPVERGVWVLKKLLNDPPPPAPANVPLITRLANKALTTREKVTMHQELPQCKSCHRKIDPIGFGLENFDAVGQWRTENSYHPLGKNGKRDKKRVKKWTIDSSGALHKGPSFKDYFELRDIIASKADAFSHGFSQSLVEYALGRPSGISDEMLIEKMVKGSKSHAMRDMIHILVSSKTFKTK